MSKPDLNKVAALAKGIVPAAAGIGAVVFGGSFLANNCMFTVDAGFRALKFSRLSGVGAFPHAEGLHFIMPWLERPIFFDIRTRPRVIQSVTGSRDLQMIQVNLRTLIRPDEQKLDTIYRHLGLKYDEKVLPSIVNEVLKSIVAQFNAAELVKQREQVSSLIKQRLTERARDFNILLDDVSIVHLSFSPEYEKAVESKQVAQQQAERARFRVLKAQEEKKNIIIKAQGEGEAAELIGHAIKNNPGFVQLRRIDAAKQVAEVVSKGANRLVLSSDALMLNLMEQSSTGNKVTV